MCLSSRGSALTVLERRRVGAGVTGPIINNSQSISDPTPREIFDLVFPPRSGSSARALHFLSEVAHQK